MFEPHKGEPVYVLKYGAWYPGTIVKRGRTRVTVAFTTKSGKAKEAYVPHWDVKPR